MPLPWKKTRISQLVADHLHPPKSGHSLVVQTGFPTSLIDLFHKNRDRLKKPSKKKRSTTRDSVPPPPLSPPMPPLNNFNSASIASPTRLACQAPEPRMNRIGNENVVGDVVVGNENIGVDGVEKPDANRVFVAVLKIFFVVVLALSTKRFVVGISMSAFLLFFIEYAGKSVCKLFKPCSNARKMLKIMVQRVLCVIRIKQEKVDGEISLPMAPMDQEVYIAHDCCDLNASIAEIQVVQTKSNLVPRVEVIRIGNGAVGYNKRLEFFEERNIKKGVMEREEDYECEVSNSKHPGSRRAKMKSKMKKLVPKKLRKSKKKGSGSKSEVCNSMEEDKGKEQEQDKDVEQCEFECLDEPSILSSTSYDGEGDGVDAICSSGELSREGLEATEVTEEVGKETRRNSGYWVLCLVVLVGLVGGRVLALALTLSWFLMMKSVRTLRIYLKVRMGRSVEISR